MEIKIGIKNVSREIALDIEEGRKEEIIKALETGGILRLTDKRDSEVVIDASAIAYVDFAPTHQHRIGFAL